MAYWATGLLGRALEVPISKAPKPSLPPGLLVSAYFTSLHCVPCVFHKPTIPQGIKKSIDSRILGEPLSKRSPVGPVCGAQPSVFVLLFYCTPV